MAATALATPPNAVTMTTGAVSPSTFMSSSRSKPSSDGICQSERTTSTRSRRRSWSASATPSAAIGSWPARSSIRCVAARTTASSSTMRTRATSPPSQTPPSITDSCHRQRRRVEDLTDLPEQLVGREGLLEELGARLEHALLPHALLRVPGDEEHAQVRAHDFEPPDELPAAEAGHYDVGHDEGDGCAGVLHINAEGVRSVDRGDYAIARAHEGAA